MIFGIGGGRQTRGVNQERTAICLQAMTGNIGISGGSTGAGGLVLLPVHCLHPLSQDLTATWKVDGWISQCHGYTAKSAHTMRY